MAYPSTTLIPANARRICSFSYGRGCRAPITVSREITTTVLQTAAHGRVGLRRAHAAGRGQNEQLLVSAASVLHFDGAAIAEPQLPARRPLKTMAKNMLEPTMASCGDHIDITNLKRHVLMVNMKDVSTLAITYRLTSLACLMPIQ